MSHLQNTSSEDARAYCERLLGGSSTETGTKIKQDIGRVGMNIGGIVAGLLITVNPIASVGVLFGSVLGAQTLSDGNSEASLRRQEMQKCMQDQMVKNHGTTYGNVTKY